MTSYQYRKSHCGDKTILRSSYLHNGISYSGKMTSLYWIRALVTIRYILTLHLGHQKVTVMVMNDDSISFIPCQSALPFLRYGYLKIQPWKSMFKAMRMVKGQGHIVGSATHWFNSFSFHINQWCYSRYTAIKKFDLENPRLWPRSKLMATFEA